MPMRKGMRKSRAAGPVRPPSSLRRQSLPHGAFYDRGALFGDHDRRRVSVGLRFYRGFDVGDLPAMRFDEYRKHDAVSLAELIAKREVSADYNHHGYHESIDNLTPADVYCGRGSTILAERQRIKRQTIANRRLRPDSTT